MDTASIPFMRRIASVVVLVLTAALITACPFDDSDAITHQRANELTVILSELQSLEATLTENSSEMRGLQQQVLLLEENTIACTLDRFINDECGDYNQPFDLTMALCAETAASADVAGTFAVNNNNTITLGAGWDWGVDVNLGRSIEFPGIPGAGWATLALGNPVGFVFGSPFPNLQAGVNASAGLVLDGCIQVPVNIRDVPREQVIALMETWQAQGIALQQSIISSTERMDLEPNRISSGLAALETVQSKSMSAAADAALTDPFEMFSRGSSLGTLVEVLPIGDRIQQVLDDPGLFVEPLSIDVPRSELADVNSTCDLFNDPGAPPLLRVPMTTACRPLKAAPNFNDLVLLIERIGKLPNVNKTRNVICDNVVLSIGSTIFGCQGS